MSSTSSKLSLKRRRPNVVENDVRSTKVQLQIDSSINKALLKNFISRYINFKQSNQEGRARCIFQHYQRTAHLLNDGYKQSNGRLFRNDFFFFQMMLISLMIVSSPSLSNFRFVTGELQHSKLYREENSTFKNRGNSNQSWEDGEQHGIHTLLKYNRRGGGMPIPYIEREDQRGYKTDKGRELVGEALDRFIQQQNVTSNIQEKLPPALRSDFGAESQSPYETNVSSRPLNTQPPFDEPIATIDYGESIRKGNPLIQSTIPINFQVELLVNDTIANELLKGLEVLLKNYLQTEYQKLIDLGSSESEKTDDMLNFASKTLKLGEVDLTLSLVESKWWQGRHTRRLVEHIAATVRGSIQSRRRNMLEGRQSGNTKLMTINADGSVNYSMEVDGSLPTPDDIEKEWNEAYIDITSRNRIQRAIEDANIEGVLRLEQVTTEVPVDRVKNDLDTETTEVINGSVGNESYNDTSSNGDIASLYENNTDDNSDESFGIDASGNIDEMNSSENPSQLERPSTLSIIFGFILTGIAILGLVAYAYIFYRKRKKRLKKKRKMKESITFSSASAAVASAASATKRDRHDHNSQFLSQNKSKPTLSSVDTPHSSQIQSNPMILSQTESEETSYKGLESSIGSHDISDSFANELKLAASHDQEIWNESQRMKETLEKREDNRFVSNNILVNKNRNSSLNARVPSSYPTILEEDKNEERPSSWIKSFPYGDEDEAQGRRNSNDDESGVSSPLDKWESYNLVLPPLLEEKKDETSPSEFFARKLKNIEKDLTKSGVQQGETPRREFHATDDVGSNSDILSEVSELSRYVRRYERRKDRRMKREEYLNERLGVVEGTQTYSSTPKTMSIGMDGHVYRAHNRNHYDENSPSFDEKEQIQLSSYADSYPDAQHHEASVLESMSFVSDDENNEEKATRSQRLGISPYNRSSDELYYKNGIIRNKVNLTSNRTRTSSSQKKFASTPDNYRHSVGYSQDHSKSSSSRLADLRANDAIIDNSNSEVNVNYDALSTSNEAIKVPHEKIVPMGTRGRGAARILNDNENTETILSAATPQQSDKASRTTTNNNRFDKLRGLFEQKTNDRPEPIYPPGEHWQYAGSLGK